MSWYASGKFWCFVGGAVAAAAVGAASQSKAVRDLAVKGVAQGMLLKENCDEAAQSIKDDAEDLAADARREAKVEAVRRQRMAEIEERVRKQVEAEIAEAGAEAEVDASGIKEGDLLKVYMGSLIPVDGELSPARCRLTRRP